MARAPFPELALALGGGLPPAEELILSGDLSQQIEGVRAELRRPLTALDARRTQPLPPDILALTQRR